VGAGLDLAETDHRAIRRSGALIGLAGAIGALGGVMVNLAFRQSFLTLKNGDGACVAFIAFLRRVLPGHLGRIHAAASRTAAWRLSPIA
jgi:nitrate/nitrite transporter NarK